MAVTIRQLRERDLPDADRIFRLAFGTFIGLPDPLKFAGDTDFVGTRWRAYPAAALAAEIDGRLVGSNFAADWGSVGFFGPLSVHPDLWQQGVAKRLMQATMELFAEWKTKHLGLYTFADSPKHIGLYGRFGFWPRFLTAVMSKPAQLTGGEVTWSRYSEVAMSERDECLRACGRLADAVFPGLSIEREIRAIDAQKLGDTLLLWDGGELVGLAACHSGAGTEAGSGACYVKFGVVRPGIEAGPRFRRLLDACDHLTLALGAEKLVAGVNAGREAAYRQMIAHGFRTEIQGVAMHRPNEPGYNRPDVYAIDDWR
jgi:GNAT superfamily N-acetyltransferase